LDRSQSLATLLLALNTPLADRQVSKHGGKIASRQTLAPRMEEKVFRTPKSTDVAAAEQAARAAAEGMTPMEYEEATRRKANDWLGTEGAHTAGSSADAPVQTAGFLKQLWDVDSIPAVPAEAKSDSGRVLATVYEIGGPLTGILSTSVAKKLPLIPHVGIRLHDVEYFYSDHIEYRTIPVMEEMLGDRPQVTLDLGPATMSPEEVKEAIASLEASWSPDDYHVFDKNCVHFADLLAAKVSSKGLPQPLLQGVLDVSERMLDSLPEWRRALGRRVMNEVTRLVVVSWGKASKKKKEETAEKLGLDKGE